MKFPVGTKQFLWGGVSGAAALAIVGFSFGGWVTGGTATKQSAAAAHDATVVALAPICAEQFRTQPDATAKLASLGNASSWDRRGIVERSGFATPKGGKSNSDVAGACAELLAKVADPKSKN